ncbi:hypothetical protein V6Z11_D04G136300 [Gossypium hirsutum]
MYFLFLLFCYLLLFFVLSISWHLCFLLCCSFVVGTRSDGAYIGAVTWRLTLDLARRRYTRADATCARRRPGSATTAEAISETARVSAYALGLESGLNLGTGLRFGPLGWCWVIGYSG